MTFHYFDFDEFLKEAHNCDIYRISKHTIKVFNIESLKEKNARAILLYFKLNPRIQRMRNMKESFFIRKNLFKMLERARTMKHAT